MTDPYVILETISPLLFDGPTEEAFRILCRLIDTHFKCDEVGVQIILDAVSDWPDHVRLLSVSWADIVHALCRPSWQFVRILEINLQTAPTEDEVSEFASRIELETLSGLRLQGTVDPCYGLEGGELTNNNLHAILTSPRLRNLVELKLQLAPSDSIYNCIANLIESGTLKNINHLELLLVSTDAPLLLERNCPQIRELVLFTIDQSLQPASVTRSLLGASTASDLPSALASSGSLCSKLQSLDLSGNDLAGVRIDAILQKGHFPSLKDLVLRQCGLGSHELSRLCDSDFIRQLRRIVLRQNPLLDKDWERLAEVPFDRIRSLDLSETLPQGSAWIEGGGDNGASIISQSASFNNIIELNLTGNNVGDVGLHKLAQAHFSSTIETMLLGSNPFGDEGIILFCERGDWKRLLCLDIGTRRITDSGVCAIASCIRLTSLRSLSLNTTLITSLGLLALCHSNQMGQLRELHLGHCALDDNLITLIVREAAWAHLHRLSLNNNCIGDQGIQFLSNSPFATSITMLDLSSNPIGNEGGLAIAKSEHFRRLNTLDLRGSSIDESIIAAIIDSPKLPLLGSVFH